MAKKENILIFEMFLNEQNSFFLNQQEENMQIRRKQKQDLKSLTNELLQHDIKKT